MSTHHLITTEPKITTCPRCGLPVLEGHAEGLRAVVDLPALTQTGEIAALLAGLATYTLGRPAGLVHRDADRIAGGHLRGTIHAQHQCGRQVPAGHRAPAAPLPPQPDYDGPPPFEPTPAGRPPPVWWIADVRNRAWRRHLAASTTQQDDAWGNTRCGLRGQLLLALLGSKIPLCQTCEGAP